MKMSEVIKLREAIIQGSQSLSDEIAYQVPQLFQKWEINKQYNSDDRIQYNSVLYKCLQSHTSQTDWSPDIAVSLWVQVNDYITNLWPEWKQPIGAQDAYMINDQVSYNDEHWICVIDNNVWEPGVYGWQLVNN